MTADDCAPGDAASLGLAPALEGVSEDGLRSLAAAGSWRDVDPGVLLITEGDLADSVQIICSGSANVLKSGSDGADYQVNTVSAGDLLGEPGLLSGTQRQAPATRTSASVLSGEAMRVFRIDLERLGRDPSLAEAHAALLRNAARSLINRLGGANQASMVALKDSLDKQRMFAAYLLNLTLVFSAFALSLYVLDDMLRWFARYGWTVEFVRTVHSVIFSILLFAGLAFCLRRANVSLSGLGVVRPRWGADTAAAVAWAIPMLVAMALLRAAFHPQEHVLYPYVMQREPLGSLGYELGIALFYFGLMCPMQEFIARIGLQAMLLDNLREAGRAGVVQAVLVSAVGFGAFHAVFGLRAVCVTFALGLYLGAMFHIHRSLTAVALCHIIAGAAGFYWFGSLR